MHMLLLVLEVAASATGRGLLFGILFMSVLVYPFSYYFIFLVNLYSLMSYIFFYQLQSFSYSYLR